MATNEKPLSSNPADEPHGLAGHFSELTGGLVGPGRHYSRFVTAMRMGLLFLAVGLIALMVSIGIELRQQQGFNLSFATIDAETGEPAMLNPKFTGVDQANRPFTVEAEKAVQDSKNSREVRLVKLHARLKFGQQDNMLLNAPSGSFQQNSMLVTLNAPVTVVTDSGYKVTGGTVAIDLKHGTAESKEKLEGQGPLGYFKAGGMRAAARGQRLYFSGRVHLLIKPEQLDNSK